MENNLLNKALISLAVIGLVGCGGGGGSTGTSTSSNSTSSKIKQTNSQTVKKNVALASNGATVTATYDVDSAQKVIDGDTSTSIHWSGNISNDSVTVDLGSVITLQDLTIYTNDTTFSTSSPTKIVEISSDGTSWKTTAQLVGGDVACQSVSLGNGKIFCAFVDNQNVRFIKVKITTTSDVGLINIYEIEATNSVNQYLRHYAAIFSS